MERRDFIAGAVTTLVASSAAAQTPTLFGQGQDKQPSEDELSAAYKVCRERGHVATAFGNNHGATFTDAVYRIYPDRHVSGYVAKQEGAWDTCFYCKKQFRFVTTQEEK